MRLLAQRMSAAILAGFLALQSIGLAEPEIGVQQQDGPHHLVAAAGLA